MCTYIHAYIRTCIRRNVETMVVRERCTTIKITCHSCIRNAAMLRNSYRYCVWWWYLATERRYQQLDTETFANRFYGRRTGFPWRSYSIFHVLATPLSLSLSLSLWRLIYRQPRWKSYRQIPRPFLLVSRNFFGRVTRGTRKKISEINRRGGKRKRQTRGGSAGVRKTSRWNFYAFKYAADPVLPARVASGTRDAICRWRHLMSLSTIEIPVRHSQRKQFKNRSTRSDVLRDAERGNERTVSLPASETFLIRERERDVSFFSVPFFSPRRF